MNIKNNYQKSFLWCHVRHINLIKVHPERITRTTEKLLIILIMMGRIFRKKKVF